MNFVSVHSETTFVIPPYFRTRKACKARKLKKIIKK